MAQSAADAVRRQSIDSVLALKRENLSLNSAPYWVSPSGYNYGRWADKGFNIALGILGRNQVQAGETGPGYLHRVMLLISAQREEYRADADDEDGACSGALDAALWAIRAAVPNASLEPEVTEDDSGSIAHDADWEVWYRDTFDWETRPSMEVEGRGLVGGLTELWARHLGETVQRGGLLGFSRFHLLWNQGHVTIEGPWEGAVRLREWIFGSKHSFSAGYVDAADRHALAVIATTHARLAATGRSSEDMLEAAVVASDWQDLEARLSQL